MLFWKIIVSDQWGKKPNSGWGQFRRNLAGEQYRSSRLALLFWLQPYPSCLTCCSSRWTHGNIHTAGWLGVTGVTSFSSREPRNHQSTWKTSLAEQEAESWAGGRGQAGPEHGCSSVLHSQLASNRNGGGLGKHRWCWVVEWQLTAGKPLGNFVGRCRCLDERLAAFYSWSRVTWRREPLVYSSVSLDGLTPGSSPTFKRKIKNIFR